ncbi:MAG: MoxR family ATPase [Planctomycetota bacterium]|nr:MoxR family ATPase [Planctomycetota bacterium]
MQLDVAEIKEKVAGQAALLDRIRFEVKKVVVGQDDLVSRLLIALLCGGRVLLEGVPGLAKTTLVKTLAQVMRVSFQRIQFTPDLLPADLVGTLIYNPQDGAFSVKKGPVFANVVLADEINRAPSKVQSALLEAMQEHQVTIGEETFKLDEPFLVMATQNPIEQEGTYPLPEAQVDRFMLKVHVDYLDPDEEMDVVERALGMVQPTVEPILSKDDLDQARSVLQMIYVDEKIKRYVIDLITATRRPKESGLDDLSPLIEYGASPRASIWLTMAARAQAFLKARGFVTPQDVKDVALDVLRHRVLLTYEAEAEEVTSDAVVEKILASVPVP